MGRMKNKVFLRWAGISAVVIVIAMTLTAVFTWRRCEDYERQVRISIGSLLGALTRQYPDIREEELISILNQEKVDLSGEKILTQYGITQKVAVIAALEREEQRMVLAAGGGVLLAGGGLLVVFFLFLRSREKRLSELTEYMGRVSRHDYSLALNENSEDELSHLQNELYKITVMLKEASERDQTQREAIQESVSDISHQLKTPLTSVQILLDNLLEDAKMEETVRVRFLEEISRQTEGISFLTGALLKLSRLDADVVEFARERIKLADMLEEICQKLAVLAEVKEVTLLVQGEKNAFIWGDYQWNMEALMNIVKNAVEHSRNGTAVTISISENDVYTEIKVRDCGEGIAPEDVKHIFERFYRAGNAARDSVGIGLAMAKTIIEKQGGYILVDSKEGEGTTFTVKYMKLFLKESPKSHSLSL